MFKLYKYETIDSTNTEAKRLLQGDDMFLGNFSVPCVITAKGQTAGRGRQGKSFYSPESTGLYMSIVDEFPADEKVAALITIRASMAVAEAIFKCTGIRVGIKWVNDLYISKRKICGILAESVIAHGKHYVIIGVGVNISTENFPTEISGIAGSLGVKAASAQKIIDELCMQIAENILSIKKGAYSDMEMYREHSVVLRKEVEYEKNGSLYCGTAVEITEMGGLAVELSDGTKDILQSGEISLKKW